MLAVNAVCGVVGIIDVCSGDIRFGSRTNLIQLLLFLRIHPSIELQRKQVLFIESFCFGVLAAMMFCNWLHNVISQQHFVPDS